MLDLAGLFNLKSPLSVLATDMDANLAIAQSEIKTPRRFLINDLKTQEFLQDSDSDLSDTPISPPKRSFLFQNTNKPPIAPPTKDLPKTLFSSKPSTNGSSHWAMRNSQKLTNNTNNSFTRHQSLQTIPAKKRDWMSKVKTDVQMDIDICDFSESCNPPKLRKTQIQENANLTQSDGVLPWNPTKDNLKQITPETLVQLFNGAYDDKIHSYTIVDCRYGFEFRGGHIIGAQNISTPALLEESFFKTPEIGSGKHLIIFHCEYSIQRAPRMALHFRGKDRNLNMMDYPKLYYPEMYILKGGYREFYSKFKERCDPVGYVEMQDDMYRDEYKSELCKRQFRKSFSEGFLG